jgi:hypothetical protein
VPDAGGDCSGAAGQAAAGRSKARSQMSFTSLARLPPWRRMTRCSSRHSGWFGMMPRSRQMSAMTAPIGRRRTSAVMRSGVGRRARCGLVASVGGAAGRAGGDWHRRGARGGRGCGVQPGGVADQPGFECLGAEQAAGDARENLRDVAGAERVRVRVAAERGGKVSAVVDELTDEGEEAAGAVGIEGGGGFGGGHGGDESTGGEPASYDRA